MRPVARAAEDLATFLRTKAQQNSGRTAVRFVERSLTYTELNEGSERVATGLRRAGIEPGERVAALLPNGPAFALAWFGTTKACATFVPLNTGLRGDLLRYELADCQPRCIVLSARYWPNYAPFRDRLRIPREWVLPDAEAPIPEGTGARPWAEMEGHALGDPLPPPHPDSCASILYTSGTTGPPKGVMLPHRRTVNTPTQVASRAELSEDSILFTTLPLFHCNAQEKTLLTALAANATAAIPDRFHASNYWETAQEYGATHVSLLTSMITVVYKQPPRARDRTHGVRRALTSGMDAMLWRSFEDRFNVRVQETYGLTECGCTSLMNPPDVTRPGSVGTPLDFVEAAVVDDHDRPVRWGDRGELVLRPKEAFTMFQGYWGKPEATAESWRNLWFHTGDYVRRDAEGYYYFIDRKKDMIRRRGENVAPFDVEGVVNRYPGVLESVAVGVPAEVGEEEVKVFVVERSTGSVPPRELLEFCASELPFYMVPKFVEIVGAIPKTANEKPQRFRLKEIRTLGGTVYDRERLGVILRGT